MKYATALFTYNRSYHTEQVLNALYKNSILPEKLFIFHDGLKTNKDKEEWEKVQLIIEKVNWCNKEIIISNDNKGLAKSIIDGINLIFESYDAVVVLEDDCVPAPSFMMYMKECLNKYAEDKRICNIGGYTWPIQQIDNKSDVYFNGRTSSWGWGTWKDRWKDYCQDKNILNRIRLSNEKSRALSIWGSDLEIMLNDRLEGRNNSWAVFWALLTIEKEGVCVNPCKSLINNIGFDGTGVHCVKSNEFDTEINENIVDKFKLQDFKGFDNNVELAYVEVFGGYTAINDDMKKPHVIVYGIGRNWLQIEKEVNDSYWVEAFVDRNKSGFFAGKKILSIDEISDYDNPFIIISLKDIKEANLVKKMLIRDVGMKNNQIRIWEER